jgi:four helix bundle protein
MILYGFQNVIAWQKSHAFVIEAYRVTKKFPEDERFGLTSQFRRAAVSIEANIAEGYKRISKADKLRMLNIAQGSLEECRDYLILSRDFSYIDETDIQLLYNSLEEASRFLNSYCKGIINNNGIKD